MGRTVPSAAMLLMQVRQDFSRFKRALSKTDQRIFEELFVDASQHVAEVGFAAHPIPSEMFMLAMLLEMHHEVLGIKEEVDEISKLMELQLHEIT
jgi:hypothetical protein